jgi:DNA-binding FadR family transcriptional regulator
MFRPSKQSRAFEDVLRQIQEAILQGPLKVGDKLPAERQLREQFQVSRGTLREALRALEQKGLIRIRTGVRGGAIVCPVDTKLVSESLDLLLRYQKIGLGELAEFREAVEGVVAAAAARKATRDDVQVLRGFVRTIETRLASPDFDWDAIVREDNKFHFALARITGNRVFESVVQTIYENIYPYFDRFLSRERRLMERNHTDLVAILEAIARRDANRARTLVQNHVRYFNRLMEHGKNGRPTPEVRDGTGGSRTGHTGSRQATLRRHS